MPLSLTMPVEPRKFEGDWVDGGKPFTVYLGIRRFNPMGENVTTLTGTETSDRGKYALHLSGRNRGGQGSP